jgi:hypothetical protein
METNSTRRTSAELASAIYGTLVVMAVIATLSHDPEAGGTEIALVAVATVLVFWTGHVYAGVVARQFASDERLSLAVVRSVARDEWPLVKAAGLPLAVLLLGPLGVLSDETAETAAVFVGAAALFGWGLVVARRHQRPPLTALLVASGSAGLGVVIAVLKVVIH